MLQWVEQCVIGLSLCPFASAPYRSGRVRVVICDSDCVEGYLATIKTELEALKGNPDTIETTLIASITALPDFLDFNDFLADVEALLPQENLESQFQLASFHPQYQFAGTDKDDAGNYTNRAPYPVIQWLRADTVAKAVETTDTLAIPEKNINRLETLERMELRMLFPWVG